MEMKADMKRMRGPCARTEDSGPSRGGDVAASCTEKTTQQHLRREVEKRRHSVGKPVNARVSGRDGEGAQAKRCG